MTCRRPAPERAIFPKIVMAITARSQANCHSQGVGWICNESSLPSRAQTAGRNFVFRPFFFALPADERTLGAENVSVRRRVAVRWESSCRDREKNGRSGGIRTHDPHTPSVVRYQAALRSDYFVGAAIMCLGRARGHRQVHRGKTPVTCGPDYTCCAQWGQQPWPGPGDFSEGPPDQLRRARISFNSASTAASCAACPSPVGADFEAVAAVVSWPAPSSSVTPSFNSFCTPLMV